jgi:hypothetical protein
MNFNTPISFEISNKKMLKSLLTMKIKYRVTIEHYKRKAMSFPMAQLLSSANKQSISHLKFCSNRQSNGKACPP